MDSVRAEAEGYMFYLNYVGFKGCNVVYAPIIPVQFYLNYVGFKGE